MGYFLLSISLISGAVKGYCGKKTGDMVTGFSDAMLANTIRMLLCIIIGFLVIACGGSLDAMIPTPVVLGIAALSGISTSSFVVSWLVSVKKGAYMMLDVFLMMGILVPILAGRIFFDEAISIKQILGLALLLIAVMVMCSYNNSIKGKMSLSSFLLLVLCGLSNGITDFSQKLFVKTGATSVSVFNFYTYVFSALTLILVYWFTAQKEKKQGALPKTDFKKMFGYICIMSVCLFANSFFKTQAAHYLDSVQLYPLNQGASLLLSTLMSAVLFRERLNSKCIAGILLSFMALLLINLL